MNYYNEIKNKLIDNEMYERVKDYSKERNRVITYLAVGKLLNDAGNKYGDRVISNYSKKLIQEVSKKYSIRYLYDIRKFYHFSKVHPVGAQLSWSHYRILLSIKNDDKIKHYIHQAISLNLSRNDLREKIKSQEYDRLPEETKEKIKNEERLEIKDVIPNPIIIKNKNNHELISEKVLQQIILEDIPSFLKELGNGFTFIENEYKCTIGNSYNYIDLLLYNIEYKCYVVVELKVTELKKEHIGQIEVYMNYIDKHLKTIEEDKTIGIIICKKDNRYLIEYCSDPRIISKEYKII